MANLTLVVNDGTSDSAPVVVPITWTQPSGGGDLATPSGYKNFYVHDWAQDGDDGKWPATVGKAGNNAAQFTNSTKNVSYISGVGQRLTAYDDGTSIFSGRVQANIKAPTFGYWRWICTVQGMGQGAWPSLWARGDDSVGELDVMEMFGGHLSNGQMICKGTNILTGSSSSYNQGSKGISYDTAIPKPAWGSEHMYEVIWGPTQMEFIVDQKSVGIITQASLDALSKNKSIYNWADQFADATRTWHLRADAQAGSVAANSSAGAWPLGQGRTFSQTQRAVGIYVKAA